MRGTICCVGAFSILLILTSCTVTYTASPPEPTSSSKDPVVEKVAAQYQKIERPFTTAMQADIAALVQNAPSDLPSTYFADVQDPLQTFDQGFMKIAFPSSLQADASKLLMETDDMYKLDSQIVQQDSAPDSALESWSAANQMWKQADIRLRSDLALPSSQYDQTKVQ
jgi:hypothetical protein